MKFSHVLAAIVLSFAVAASPARADDVSPADAKLAKEFYYALLTDDVEDAKMLMAAPNFSPTLHADNGNSLFGQALALRNIDIARLMMKTPAWETTQ